MNLFVRLWWPEYSRRLGIVLGLLGALVLPVAPVRGQDQGTVYLVPITDTIDLGNAPYLTRVLDEAAHANARAVVLEIDTPGGRLDAVLQMRDAILDSPIPTIAYVNRQAFSAGALVALAADELYMAPGAVLGAATPVDGGGTPADAKTIAAVRSVFRATAELRNRDPLVAEAIVDPALAIDGLVGAGQLLTLTTHQAEAIGYLDGIAADRQALLAAFGSAPAEVVQPEQSWAETLVRVLTNPLVASLLLAIGLLLLAADGYSGGVGVIGGAGLVLIGAFFWGHMLVGLAGWEGVALVVAGLILIAVEVFVIPGFGLAGILGVVALFGGVFISLFDGRIVTRDDLARATSTVLGTLLLLAGGGLLVLRYLPRTLRLPGLVLQAQVGSIDAAPPQQPVVPMSWLYGERLDAQRTTTSTHAAPSLEGAIGTARSDLRPGGIADIDGVRVDVVSRGEYIPRGSAIEVLADQGYRRVVRRIDQEQRTPGTLNRE